MGFSSAPRLLVLAVAVALAAIVPAALAGTHRVGPQTQLSKRKAVSSSRVSSRQRDSDRDGLSDDYEMRVSKTNPKRWDTDGDGRSDGAEVRLGSNPRDPKSPAPVRTPTSTPTSAPAPAPAPAPTPEEPPAPTPEEPPAPTPEQPAPEEPPAPEPPPPPPAPEPQPETSLYVDVKSLGGACSDSRTAAQVTATKPWCSLLRAAQVAPDGSLVIVRGGTYPDTTFDSSVNHATKVTLKAKAGETPVTGYTVAKQSARGLRLEGFKFTEPVDIWPGTVSRFEVAGSEFGNFTNVGVSVGPGATDVAIEGNYFHDLQETGTGNPNGVGIRASGYSAPITRLRIAGNTFDRTKGGALEIDGVVDPQIVGNEIKNVFPDSERHADPIELGGGSGILVKDNYIHHNQQAVMVFPGVQSVSFENNLIAHSDNYAMNFQGNVPGGVTLRNNTFWDNDFGGVYVQKTFAGGTIQNNVFQALNLVPSSLGASENWNLIASGPRYGAQDVTGPAKFVNAAKLDYRLVPGTLSFATGTTLDAP